MLDLLLPPRCLACRVRADEPWCDACRAEVEDLPAGCVRCAGRDVPGHGCWPAVAPIDATVARHVYAGPVAAAVVAAKVGGAHRGWAPLAAGLAPRLVGVRVDLVTWVTTVPARVRRRGTDHAAVLAGPVGAMLGAPVRRTLRAGPTPRHPEDLVAERRLRGAPRVALVDDVLTTGATAWRAAAALRAAGAGAVTLVVLARAGAHALGPTPARPPTRPT